ncbi:MAG TPA: methyltransferase domain-containing protein [Alphaproteobacteria bacterium]|nr:methyltransferase domain-containing protein [Alphaproteobacteria bacterium]
MSSHSQINVFDRTLLRRRRDRAAHKFGAHRVLFDEAGAHLQERLEDVTRDFPMILDLGAHDGALAHRLAQREGVFVASMDLSARMARQAPKPFVIGDEEFLPFAANSFDLIISNLSLHWVNDLPGALAQIKYALKPNGLFLASVFGGETLHELRSCLMDAEMKIMGGVSPRLSPMLDLQAASGLMQRAGFSLPVTDREMLTLTYPDIFVLMHDLRGMGETNVHLQRLKRPARKALFMEAGRLYRERFGGLDGAIPASFEILFLHGWKQAV